MTTDNSRTFFVTFRTYGTWMRGERAGWRPGGEKHGQPPAPTCASILAHDREQMKHERFYLDSAHSAIVISSVSRLCERRGWKLVAIAVTRTHVHCLLVASAQRNQVLGDMKAFATRGLRAAGAIAEDRPPWSRGGSVVSVRGADEVESVVRYIRDEHDGGMSRVADA